MSFHMNCKPTFAHPCIMMTEGNKRNVSEKHIIYIISKVVPLYFLIGSLDLYLSSENSHNKTGTNLLLSLLDIISLSDYFNTL